jgi:hypothetical protein
MGDPTTYENRTPPHPLSDHEIALVMTALQMAGRSKYDLESIQHEYMTARGWLKEFRSQPGT